MANDLPVALQERIMMLAGLGDRISPTAAANKRNSPPAKAVTPPSPPLPPPLERASSRLRLTPSDLFVLENEHGPGFIILDNFLGDPIAQVRPWI